MITEGQKIAKKLSTQVAREIKKIKALLQEYNACQAVAGSTCCLTVADALDSAMLTQILHPKLCALTPDKQELINSYIMLTRRKEVVEMLKCDMSNVLHYYNDRKAIITSTIESFQQESDYSRGACNLLKDLLHATNLHMDVCRKSFSVCLHELETPFFH